MKKRYLIRVCRALMCLAMVFCVLAVDLSPALAVTQEEINELKNDASDLKSKRKELEGKLAALSDDKAEAMNRKKLLDQQISNTSAQIQNVEAQIANYSELIDQTQAELEVAEEQEAAQYELFCKQVRSMEEDGNVDYWAVLFRAKSFSDLLGRLDIINEIMDYNQRVIQDLKDLQAEIAAKKASLETSKAESEAAKAELVATKKDLDAQRTEANRLIQQIRDNESAYKSAVDDLEREEEEILAMILRKSQELAAQQAAQGRPVQSNPGGYIWPVDSRYITSTVGGRTSPGGVGSTNHKGTDIGRVGYTSPIYAAKAGTVIVSQYSSSYGHYVVISHGDGNTTLYGHMSSRKVPVGQYVNQGDVIGITGSTGNSTGPHLHFEITENGVRVNPLSHGAQPQKGYLTGYTLSGTSIGT